MKRLFFPLVGLVALGFTAMWLAGLFYYSAVGVDHNLHDPERTTYYRIWWPGDGRIGLGTMTDPHPPKDVDEGEWDPGGMFFHPPRREEKTAWYHWAGFRRVVVPEDSPALNRRFPNAMDMKIAYVPAWLPALAVGWWPLRRLRKKASIAAGSGR